MGFVRFYITVSIAIGVMQVAEGMILITDGMSPLIILLTLIELFWFFISLTVVKAFKKIKQKPYAPFAFITYYVAMVIIGFFSPPQVENSNIDLLSSIEVPLWVKLAGVIFGACFAVYNFNLRRDVQQKQESNQV